MEKFLDSLPFSLTTIIIVVLIGCALLITFIFRRVVPTNMVHIVQSRNTTTSYGTGATRGNVYYEWPSWLPIIGITKIDLPVSNFNLNLRNYEAYDKERVPFVLDLTAFFRISDTNVAAQRISSRADLENQLTSILQGAVRKILASYDINSIMTERATFGEQFTAEVESELKNWGVEPVKNVELMDIRDSERSTVISDIMAKKSSQINMESRKEVANNTKEAEVAEIEAKRAVAIEQQQMEKLVGEKTAEKTKAVGIANEKANQEVALEKAKTVTNQKEIDKISAVKEAEIKKQSEIIKAEQEKETQRLIAEGALQATKLGAEGIEAKGKAEAEAEKAKQLAPVHAQIELAKEIGKNGEYQNYLVLLEFAKAYIEVGSEQAKALQQAEVKIIANGGNASGGVKNAIDIFSANGGFAIGSMLEALQSTPQGQKVFEQVKSLVDGGSKKSPANLAGDAEIKTEE